MKKPQTLPWLRVISSIVGVSAAIIAGDLIGEGTMTYGHALGILGIYDAGGACPLGGAGLWQRWGL